MRKTKWIFLYIFLYSLPGTSTPVLSNELVNETSDSDISRSDDAGTFSVDGTHEVDFGEEGDLILSVYLHDLFLADAMFAIMQDGRIYLPLSELSSLLDFPIIVDAESERANGWFLQPDNTFDLDVGNAVVDVAGTQYSLDQYAVYSDGFDLYAESGQLQKWFPLSFEVSLSSQKLIVRSPERLPKETALERSQRNVQQELLFASTQPFEVPAYRVIDWPEFGLNVGGYVAPQTSSSSYDYNLRAAGDFALLNGSIAISGSDGEISGAAVTFGRINPRGMAGPLRIADFEFGDTSQFLPGLIGSSLSGRGLRLGNTRLANKRDLDKIDLQGDQQSGYEVELYVNNRLRDVDRDSSDNRYEFADVSLELGQNEIRIEFYGPQGQRQTDTQRTFVGNGQGRAGNFTYELAVLEPNRRVVDLIDNVTVADTNEDSHDIRFSSALNMTYGLTRRTTMGLSIASLAIENDSDGIDGAQNYFYTDAQLSTDLSGVLFSGSMTLDPNQKTAGSVAARTTLGHFEVGGSQQVFQRQFRNTGNINDENIDNAVKLSGGADISRAFFSIPGGTLSYGANIGYQTRFDGSTSTSAGVRADYMNKYTSLSWTHQYDDADGFGGGRIGTRFDVPLFTVGAGLDYSDSDGGLIDAGSLRLTRQLAGGGLSLAASRDVEAESTSYSASWGKRFRTVNFSTSIAGDSFDDVFFRFGIGFNAKRYPGRWLPAVSSASVGNAVAVLVFADDNRNGRHDTAEMVVQGVRITRNGLAVHAVTDHNGVALVTGLGNSPIDLGLITTDINEPSLKYDGTRKAVLPRPGRVPLIEVPLQRATDLEGTVTIAETTPAPNVRMVLTPVDGGEPMEIYTEFDGYYSLAHIPLGEYDFGPDPAQLESAGLVAKPVSRRLKLQNTDDFPPPENFDLTRLANRGVAEKPEFAAALPVVESGSDSPENDGVDASSESPTVTWHELKLLNL